MTNAKIKTKFKSQFKGQFRTKIKVMSCLVAWC